jgi:hypothetical protein
MMIEENTYKALRLNVGLERNSTARRCPDFEADCADVKNHAACFAGGEVFNPLTWEIFECDIADGYCPYTVGMMRSNA